jgi:opacity protein-like surface antigen
MHKYLLASAVAAAAFASPAAARDGSPYIGIEGGAVFGAESDFDVAVDDGTAVTEYDDAFELDYKTGWELDAIAGYDFGFIRAEGEIGYKRVKIDEIEVSDALLTDLETAVGGPVVIDDFDLSEKASVFSGMVNLLADFGNEDGISFYGGGGFGRARVKVLDDKDSAWAWQLIAGVRSAISDTVDVGVKYRYFRTGGLDFEGDFDAGPAGTFGLDADGRFTSHSLLASLIFNFGGAEPEPMAAPPAPPPPPPPPPATQTCPDGSVIPASSPCPLPPPPPPPPPPPEGERG